MTVPERKEAKSATGKGQPSAAKLSRAQRQRSRTLPRKPGRSIVYRKQTPWGMIAVVTLVILFGAGIVSYALTRHESGATSNTPYLNELAAAKQIGGVTFKAESNRAHVNSVVKYGTLPPIGGSHSPVWADCAGTVYPSPIADENAVHSLEHGAVWIAYRPGLARAQVDALAAMVRGQNYTFMSPYPGLRSPISAQSWGYRLSVDSAGDPRLSEFIDTLRDDPNTTPEPGGSCTNRTFKDAPSTPGRPAES